MTTDARPLSEYATLVSLYTAAVGGFLLLARGRLPERIGFGDVLRVGLGSYKLGRLIARDDVTAWVRAPVTRDEETQEPEREGMARVLGELVTCPYCIGLWAASGLSAGIALAPRETRFVTTVLGAQAVADFLNAAFVKLRAA
jgi:hypothetical protein